MSAIRIERAEAPELLYERAADALIDILVARQAEGAIPCVVLTGGSGGAALLAQLGTHRSRDAVEWRRVRFLWGDERFVPAGHEDRNDKLADDTLFAAVETDPKLVHRVPALDHGLSLDDAAAAYAAVVAGIERIDVAVSGIGPDGHVASLFPGRAELDIVGDDAPAAIPVRNSPKPPPERVSLTFPALNRADRSWLLATGAAKADAVRGILHPDADPALQLPAARISGHTDTVLWADEAALG